MIRFPTTLSELPPPTAGTSLPVVRAGATDLSERRRLRMLAELERDEREHEPDRQEHAVRDQALVRRAGLPELADRVPHVAVAGLARGQEHERGGEESECCERQHAEEQSHSVGTDGHVSGSVDRGQRLEQWLW